MKLSRIRQIAIAADDINESMNFYKEKLGAEFIARYDPPGLVFFDFEGVRLLMEKGATKATVYFWVEDIDSACRELQDRGISFDQPPHLIFPDSEGTFGPKGEEEWMAFFKDPAGNVLALASRKKPG